LEFNRRFGKTYGHHFQGQISRARYQRESRWQADWRWCVSPKRRLTFSWLHGVVSQKIVVFITTAVRTSNPTSINLADILIINLITLFQLLPLLPHEESEVMNRVFILHSCTSLSLSSILYTFCQVSFKHIPRVLSLGYKAGARHQLSRCYLARLILRPWRRRRYVPPTRRLIFSWLHGVVSQKIVPFITTAVRTSNPTTYSKLGTTNRSVRPCNLHDKREEYGSHKRKQCDIHIGRQIWNWNRETHWLTEVSS
jgi:hypothetical protein